jgi:hypothetical protein
MLRLQARKIKAVKVPIKGLMDLLGLKLADLINTKRVAGVRVDGDGLVLDPQQISPPPHIQGWVTGVRLARSISIWIIYREQLVAGYTKETLNFGLRVYMRDYNKLPKQSAEKGGRVQGEADIQ